MNLIDGAKAACEALWEDSTFWSILFLILLVFAWFLFWLKGLANEGQEESAHRILLSEKRETWCYEKGYFEVVWLDKLQKGYLCIDARDPDAIRTLIIPKEIYK